ncbi:hypothetical protein GDO78_011170 [Eleutherodactylus coqui]|uniref:KRAB domain-containing protein n=1 Tax=Eleutherodactylus coqui TaxID=57060 RepID=A0A8J6F7S4_ELECQ|nr:hypothetical protein GDO78_011170 [Eleutherodactylus coqui]
MAVQGPITFQDVAASFAEEQWMRLEDWQKEIYKTVIKEIHEAILSLGYTIINPNVVFSIKKQDKSLVRIDNQSAENNACSGGDLPDILLNIKDEPSASTSCVKTEQYSAVSLPACVPGPSNSSISIRENTVHGQMYASSTPKKSNTFPIKTEEEAYSIDEYNGAEDKQPAPSEGGLKHESDEETDTDEDFLNTTPVKEEPEAVSAGRSQQAEVCRAAARSGGDEQSAEISTSEDVGPKRRKMGSQVRGDILSLQEREARRRRVLEGAVRPFRAHPSFTLDPLKPQEVKNERPEMIFDRRRDIKNNNWCKCGHCSVMSTLEESICCHEIFGLLSQLNEEHLCITKHPAFDELCLDRDRLDFLYRFLATIKRKNDVLYYLHKLRRTSYRAFVIWAHGFIDYRKHKPVPACVVKRVQEYLPYPPELNVGYMKMYDYPAALMALDHI